MITIVYCTRETNPEHKAHLAKTCGLDKHLEIIEIVNNGESLTSAYNRGLKQAKNDIVVFCHDDLSIETKQWGTKLIKLFKNNPEYGIIGVAGTKQVPSSGIWWENPRQMYGRVAHTHEGKTWLSSYSDDLGHEIEETVIVDGVFFAIDKSRIKKTFNEDVQGFHFYDLTFCYENHLEGVKVGVTTLIRINHRSIGATNEKWEKNRIEFSDRFKDTLPKEIKRVLRKNEKLKVLIGCLNFTNLTGSELYVYELAKQLVKEGCEVSICSNIGKPMLDMVKPLGIKLYSLQEPPNYKLGDGKWLLKTQNGDVVSQENTLYRLGNATFDVMHLNHKPITEHLLRLFPEVPAICTIHSEVIALEEPIISPQIKEYIAIRPEIKDHIVKRYGIAEDMVRVIYNPIDNTKFKSVPSVRKRNKKRVLFVGTIDYLRKNSINDLIRKTAENNQELWLVGKYNGVTESELNMGPHVSYFPPTPSVEKYIQECDETAGILLGRTTIEGWMCGKKGWIYDVDSSGTILSSSLHDVPTDIDKFYANNVVKEIIEEYKSIL